MKEYVLNYYPEFSCIAGKCKHTCCAGWEMCIDGESLDRYKNEKSSFSLALKEGIDYKKSKFKADKLKRCAFLDKNGLCQIITNLGESALCQVCRDHPRFRSFFDDRVETGLGFSCEEATRIILSFKGKIEPIKVGDDQNEEDVGFNQKNLLEFRDKALNIIQDREILIDDRIHNLLKLCNSSEIDFSKAIKKFLSLERLNKTWTKRLKAIKGLIFDKQTPKELSLYAEQFLVNGMYRHLYDAEDTMFVRARTIACIISWWIIKSIIAYENAENDFEKIVDIVREYSTEVEYSQKNLNNLYDLCYKFIKI